MIGCGLGWRPDAPDARDWPLGRLLSERVAVPSVLVRPSMRHLWRGPRPQGQPRSCFGFAAATAIGFSLALSAPAPADAPELAPAFIYWNGRAQAMAADGLDADAIAARIEDDGTYPRHGMQAIQNVGFCAEVDAPYRDDPRSVRRRPPRAAYWRAYDQRGFRFARLHELAEVERALTLGHPVIFGMVVDERFIRNIGEPVRRIDMSLAIGGHMLAVLAVDDEGVHFANSWGLGWGRAGAGVLTPDCWRQAGVVGDVYAIQAAPIFRARSS